MFGNEELRNKLAESQAQVAQLGAKLDTARGHMVTLQNERDRARKVGQITDVAEAALRQAENSGEVQINAAHTAEGVTRERYVRSAEARIADQIITEHADAIALEKGDEWDNQIRARLKEKFEDDGTFDRVRRDVAADRIRARAEELREKVRREEEERLSSEEERARIDNEARKQLEDSGEAEKIRAEVRSEATKKAEIEAAQEVKSEEEAREPAFKEKWKREWRDDYSGQRFTQSIRSDLETRWKGASIGEVQQEIKDEELGSLLANKAERAKKTLREEEFRDKYLDTFDKAGIDITQIPEGFTVTLYLGEQEAFKIRNSYGYEENSPKKRVATERLLRLTALNDGRMVVEYDSLSSSSSVYIKHAAIPAGTVIHIGRKQIDNSHDHEDTLKEVIKAGMILYYDDDTRTPAMEDTHLPVANVEINGISALDLAEARILKS